MYHLSFFSCLPSLLLLLLLLLYSCECSCTLKDEFVILEVEALLALPDVVWTKVLLSIVARLRMLFDTTSSSSTTIVEGSDAVVLKLLLLVC